MNTTEVIKTLHKLKQSLLADMLFLQKNGRIKASEKIKFYIETVDFISESIININTQLSEQISILTQKNISVNADLQKVACVCAMYGILDLFTWMNYPEEELRNMAQETIKTKKFPIPSAYSSANELMIRINELIKHRNFILGSRQNFFLLINKRILK